MTHDLDGQYQITSTTSYQGPLEMKSDGTTEIRNGTTSRRDKANCLWTSTFRVISETEVEMTSLADPTDADSDFSLLRPDGSPSRQPTTYTTMLKLMRKGDKVQLSGQIEYGGNITFITMRRIAD
jgi:hypothetical protein